MDIIYKLHSAADLMCGSEFLIGITGPERHLITLKHYRTGRFCLVEAEGYNRKILRKIYLAACDAADLVAGYTDPNLRRDRAVSILNNFCK